MKTIRTLIFFFAVFSLLFQGVGAPLAFAAMQDHLPAVEAMAHNHDHGSAHQQHQHAAQDKTAPADFCHDGTNPFCGDCICHTLFSLNLSFELAPQEIHNTHLAQLREVQPHIFTSVNPRPPQAS